MSAVKTTNELVNGIPLWVKAVATLSTTSAVILLLFFLAYAFVENSRVHNTDMTKMAQTILSVANQQTDLLRRHIEASQQQLDAIVGVLRQICVQSALDADERRLCNAQ